LKKKRGFRRRTRGEKILLFYLRKNKFVRGYLVNKTRGDGELDGTDRGGPHGKGRRNLESWKGAIWGAGLGVKRGKSTRPKVGQMPGAGGSGGHEALPFCVSWKRGEERIAHDGRGDLLGEISCKEVKNGGRTAGVGRLRR